MFDLAPLPTYSRPHGKESRIKRLIFDPGPCIGLPTVRGPIITGTEAAIRAEFIEVLTDAVHGGNKINEIRENVISLRDKIRADTREGGFSHGAFVKLAWLGWEDDIIPPDKA